MAETHELIWVWAEATMRMVLRAGMRLLSLGSIAAMVQVAS